MPERCTVIVSGAPRSGTSLIAAMLRACGLWIGDLASNDTQEDGDIASAIERGRAAIFSNPLHLRLAWRGVDVGLLKQKIDLRDATFQKWGFKRPRALAALGRHGLSLFRSPRVIMPLRDPLPIARWAIKEQPDMSLDYALRMACRATDANLKVAINLAVPVMLISYEKVLFDRAGLLKALCDFCALDAAPASQIESLLCQAHANYLEIKP